MVSSFSILAGLLGILFVSPFVFGGPVQKSESGTYEVFRVAPAVLPLPLQMALQQASTAICGIYVTVSRKIEGPSRSNHF